MVNTFSAARSLILARLSAWQMPLRARQGTAVRRRRSQQQLPVVDALSAHPCPRRATLSLILDDVGSTRREFLSLRMPGNGTPDMSAHGYNYPVGVHDRAASRRCGRMVIG